MTTETIEKEKEVIPEEVLGLVNTSPTALRELDLIFSMLAVEEVQPDEDEKKVTPEDRLNELHKRIKAKAKALQLPFYIFRWSLINDGTKPTIIVMSDRPPEDMELVLESLSGKRYKVIIRGDLKFRRADVRTDVYQTEAPRVVPLMVYQPGVIKIYDKRKIDEETALPVGQYVPFVVMLFSPGRAFERIAKMRPNEDTPSSKDIKDAAELTTINYAEEVMLVADPTVKENTFLKKDKKNVMDVAWSLATDWFANYIRRYKATQSEEKKALSARLSDAFWANFKWIVIMIVLLGIILGVIYALKLFAPTNGGGGDEIDNPYYPDGFLLRSWLNWLMLLRG